MIPARSTAERRSPPALGFFFHAVALVEGFGQFGRSDAHEMVRAHAVEHQEEQKQQRRRHLVHVAFNEAPDASLTQMGPGADFELLHRVPHFAEVDAKAPPFARAGGDALTLFLALRLKDGGRQLAERVVRGGRRVAQHPVGVAHGGGEAPAGGVPRARLLSGVFSDSGVFSVLRGPGGFARSRLRFLHRLFGLGPERRHRREAVGVDEAVDVKALPEAPREQRRVDAAGRQGRQHVGEHPRAPFGLAPEGFGVFVQLHDAHVQPTFGPEGARVGVGEALSLHVGERHGLRFGVGVPAHDEERPGVPAAARQRDDVRLLHEAHHRPGGRHHEGDPAAADFLREVDRGDPRHDDAAVGVALAQALDQGGETLAKRVFPRARVLKRHPEVAGARGEFVRAEAPLAFGDGRAHLGQVERRPRERVRHLLPDGMPVGGLIRGVRRNCGEGGRRLDGERQGGEHGRTAAHEARGARRSSVVSGLSHGFGW